MSDTSLRPVTGLIFEVQRFSIHDGPGIRTTVFMKGCPLRCIWCHNPESAAPRPELSFVPSKCIGCGYCFRICPRGAHQMKEDQHVLDRGVCEVCGSCTDECYAQALEMVGHEATVGEVIDEVLRDQPFYETSSGGITLSGGEPTFQIEFTEALLRISRSAGLHTCVETCGHAEYERLERILPLVDLFLYDVKETDPVRHAEFTGASNERILENLRRLHDDGAAIRMRCPLIPGLNDREDHFEALTALAESLPRIEGIEVMPYHPLGESKTERFGLDASRRPEALTPDKATIAAWVDRLRALGATVLNETEAAREPAGK